MTASEAEKAYCEARAAQIISDMEDEDGDPMLAVLTEALIEERQLVRSTESVGHATARALEALRDEIEIAMLERDEARDRVTAAEEGVSHAQNMLGAAQYVLDQAHERLK